MMQELEHCAHAVGGWNYHVQITPKYRREMFKFDDVREVVRAALVEKAEKLGVKIEAMEFGPDHVHMFVSGCRKVAPDVLVGQLKGYSSYVVRRTPGCASTVRTLSKEQFWSDGYFAESIGRVTTETMKYYIGRQQAQHWTPQQWAAVRSTRPAVSADGKGQRKLEEFGA